MERIDDILREMRRHADEAERGDCYDLRGLGTDSLRAYADRIEAVMDFEARGCGLDTTTTEKGKQG